MHYLKEIGTFEKELSQLRDEFKTITFRYEIPEAPTDRPISLFFKSLAASETHGVYIIRSAQSENVLYIGKAGTLKNDGTLKNQGISKRLRVRRGQITAKQWLFEICQTYGALTIECIFLGSNPTPALVEALLLQSYFNETGQLPPKNKAL